MKKIVVGTDFGELATAALRCAANLAAKTGGELIVVYADTFEPPMEFTVTEAPHMVETIDNSKRNTRRELEAYVAEHVPPGVARRVIVADAHPADAIVAIAESEHADMIALGTHGRRGLSRLLVGSVAEAVMRKSSVPVLTVRTSDVSEPEFAACEGPYT